MSYVPSRKKRRIPLELETGHPYQGRIINWNDEKGYGFIQIIPGHENLFFHISSFAYHHRRPAVDTAVTLLAVPGQKDGWQATRVLLREHEHAILEEGIYDIADHSKPKKAEGYIYAVLDVIYFLTLTLLSLPLAIISAFASIAAVALYSYDKRAAEDGKQRIPNTTLHLISLVGGWPGVLIARPLLRHKLNQKRFRAFFWASILANFGILYIMIAYLPPYSPLINF
ncbi:MAG: cold shock and DUF1294 domain-containing protein [Cardiobacteriaceae bacterium]|nr:cold shock and DUF1294 domain-containing protein [Cardiobacteriaceae bacterium]